MLLTFSSPLKRYWSIAWLFSLASCCSFSISSFAAFSVLLFFAVFVSFRLSHGGQNTDTDRDINLCNRYTYKQLFIVILMPALEGCNTVPINYLDYSGKIGYKQMSKHRTSDRRLGPDPIWGLAQINFSLCTNGPEFQLANTFWNSSPCSLLPLFGPFLPGPTWAEMCNKNHPSTIKCLFYHVFAEVDYSLQSLCWNRPRVSCRGCWGKQWFGTFTNGVA